MNRVITFSLGALAMTTALSALAQALPTTDIWLVKIENGTPGTTVKISDGSGYNNQPHFSHDGSVIYYTREMPGDTATQTDIAAFQVHTSATSMLTHTSESEYSPTPIPGREALSVIQADLEQKQLLCSIDLLNGEVKVLFPDIEPVGYHVWFSDAEVAMFILGQQLPGLSNSSLRRN